MNRSLSKLLYYGFHYLVKRDKKIPYYNKSLETQWFDKNEMEKLQFEKFQKLLTHANDHSPYYRNAFKMSGFDPRAIQSLSEISKIPLLTKAELRAHLQKLVCGNTNPQYVIPNSTSGSTGEKTVFYSDRRAEDVKAALVRRAYEWVGIQLGDRELRLWGAHFDVAKSNQLKEKIFNWLNNRAVLSAYAMADASIDTMLRFMRVFHPDFLFSYPSSLVHFCDYLHRTGILPYLPPKGILTSGEQLEDWQRILIESHFRTKVYNFYGCREVGIIGQECEHRAGLHVVPENVLVEILDEDGNPVLNDVTGEIVVTDLCNFAMPFIRYRIGDRGRMLTGNCTCGRNALGRIALEGRRFDIIRSSNGNAVGGTFWTLLFRHRPGIQSFQVIQDNINHIRVDYVPESKSSLSNQDELYFREQILEKLKGIEVDFNAVEEIPVLESGKMRLTISLIDAP